MYVVMKLLCVLRGHLLYRRRYPLRGLTVRVCARCGDLVVKALPPGYPELVFTESELSKLKEMRGR